MTDKQRQIKRVLAQRLERVRGERLLKEVRELPKLVEDFARRRSTPPRGLGAVKEK